MAPSKRSGITFLTVLAISVCIVFALSKLTNRMAPLWDMASYLDMATNGVWGNHALVAPFAYRPAAPLIVGAIAHISGASPITVFHACGRIMCVAFFVCCYYFALSVGVTRASALLAALAVGLYFYIVKWTIFAGSMVDIYAYPLILLAFWTLLRRRLYLCILVSAIALFFKDFALLPLLTQAALLVREGRDSEWRKVYKPLFLILLVLLFCFLIPRLMTHVIATFQDVDPINAPESLRRLYTYPANLDRNFNILFAYLSCWLPVLLLINPRRWRILWEQLGSYRRLILIIYLVFHFGLVMYGGTNLEIFVSYSLPVELIVLSILFNEGDVRLWEKILLFVTVVLFNRLWMSVPLPQTNVDTYLDFYGGYHMLLTPRSWQRMAELLTWIAGFQLIRTLNTQRSAPKGQLLAGLRSS